MDIAETSPLERIAAMARFVFSSLAMLFGLPEAMAERPLDRDAHKLARAWVAELERFARGLVYAMALQTPSPGGGSISRLRNRGGAVAELGALCAPHPAAASLHRPSPRGGHGFPLAARLRKAAQTAPKRRRQPLASALFATERLAARFAAAEQVLANPEPLARRLARRWARNAARRARDLAHAAKPPAKSHTGKAAPYRSGDFDEPPNDTLRRVLLYENRCELAQLLAQCAN